MDNKKDKTKTIDRVKLRTKEQRKKEILNIIKQLDSFNLTAAYEPIKQLYEQFKFYINNGEKLKINIPFPMINKRIKGILATSIKEEVWLRLENEKF